MPFVITALSLSILAQIVLLAILLRNRVVVTTLMFAIYVVAITGWTASILLTLLTANALIFRFVYAFAAVGLTAQFWFAKLFPKGILPTRVYEYVSLIIGMFFCIASFVPGAIFYSVTIDMSGYIIRDNGFLSVPFAIFATTYTILPALLFWRKERVEKNVRLRTQLHYLMIGFSVFALINACTNSVLPVFFGIYFFNAIGPVFSLFLAIAVFYIIWRHQFLGIRVVIQRGIIYSTLLTIIVGTYFAVLLGVNQIAQVATGIATPLSAMIVMIIGIFTVPSLERYFREKTDRFFFKDKYEYSEALQELSDILNAHNTRRPLANKTLAALQKILRAKSAKFFPSGVTVPEQETLQIPIRTKRRELGILMLGAKRSGDPYTAEDKSLLKTFSVGLAVALEKADLFERVQKHSRELEHKVEERTCHIKELQEGQKRMISDISHAFQTPLTVLKGSLDRLAKEPNRAYEHVRIIEKSVDNISKFIYDLLRLSRLDSLPQSPYEHFDFSLLALNTAEYVETICHEHNIALILKIEKGIRFLGSKKDIEELITILLSNAVRYTKIKNAGIKTIVVNLHRVSDGIILSVSDTGVGISRDKLDHVFERFYRAHEGVSENGSGLGLAIAKRISDSHNGSIVAESTEGEGSTFTAYFKNAAREK